MCCENIYSLSNVRAMLGKIKKSKPPQNAIPNAVSLCNLKRKVFCVVCGYHSSRRTNLVGAATEVSRALRNGTVGASCARRNRLPDSLAVVANCELVKSVANECAIRGTAIA